MYLSLGSSDSHVILRLLDIPFLFPLLLCQGFQARPCVRLEPGWRSGAGQVWGVISWVFTEQSSVRAALWIRV